MTDTVYDGANNIFPLNDEGVNFQSQTLFNGLGDLTVINKFNLYDNDGYRLYQNPDGSLNTNYYTISIN